MSAETIFRTRHYLHFDKPIGPKRSKQIATDPQRVATWSFLPMLGCIIKVNKIKRIDGKLQKTEKTRAISYSGHKDAAIYSYYGYLLNLRYEAELQKRGLSNTVTAFRPDSGKCNIQFAKEAFTWISRQTECVALAFDIRSFFDTLDHKLLKSAWSQLLGMASLPPDHYAVYKSLTRFSTVDRNAAFSALGISQHNPRANDRRCLCSPEEFRSKIRNQGLIVPNKKPYGIPQGSPMSAILSNVYLLGFDSRVAQKVDSVGGLYRRYCDDMLCIVPPIFGNEIEAFVNDEIRAVRLEIQSAKTMRHHFRVDDERLRTKLPLQYLGFVFDGGRVLLRNAGIARYYSRMRSAVRLAAATKRKRGKPDDEIRRKKLNIRYSYLGGRNFVSYAIRASREFNDATIKRQLRRHWGKLNKAVASAEKKIRDKN